MCLSCWRVSREFTRNSSAGRGPGVSLLASWRAGKARNPVARSQGSVVRKLLP